MFALFILFLKIDFFLSANFFLLLFITFDDVFTLIDIIMTHCFFMIGIWFVWKNPDINWAWLQAEFNWIGF